MYKVAISESGRFGAAADAYWEYAPTSHQHQRCSCPHSQRGRLRYADRLRRPRWRNGQWLFHRPVIQSDARGGGIEYQQHGELGTPPQKGRSGNWLPFVRRIVEIASNLFAVPLVLKMALLDG